MLHRPDIWAIDGEKNVAVDLQVVRPRVFWRGDERDRFRLERVVRVHDGKAVAEHMADERMALVHENLDAIGPAALVATREVADVGCGGACGEIHHKKLAKFQGPANSRQPGPIR